MTTNRLARSEGGGGHVSKLSAADWAAIARETNRPEAAKAWEQRARDLGEELVPPGQTVRFDDKKQPRRVWIASGFPVVGR